MSPLRGDESEEHGTNTTGGAPHVGSDMKEVMTAARSWCRHYLPVVGLLLLAISGPAYYLYATSQPVIGANIGAGLAMMWTALWGLPWSIWPWKSLDRPSADIEELAFFACALVNVALLGLAIWWRRRHPSSTAETSSSAPGRQG